jgi:hypothetical protein
LALRRHLGQGLRVEVIGTHVHVADQASRAVCIGVKDSGAVAQGLCRVAPHAAQLTATQHAQGGAWQQGFQGVGGTVMARAASVC